MARRIRGKNEGSLHQRPNGTWRAQLSVDGKRISKGFKTKAEAQEWLRSTQSQLERGFDYQAGKITLAEYLPQLLESHAVSLRPKTADQYRRIIDKHILPHIGEIQVKNLRIARVEQFYGKLVQSGLGIRTVRIVHAILHKALEKALRYGLVMSNPTQGAALPRYKHGEMQVLDESQVTRFLVAAQDSPYQALYHLALTTGMRQGELLGLKWTDLQWHSGALLVQRQVQDIRGQGTIYQEPKTRAGRRTIKLGQGTLQALRLHRESQQVLKACAGSRWKDNDLIFPSKVGIPRDPSNLRLGFNRVLEKAGLPKIRFHDLRHTAASLMLNHGVPVIVASKGWGIRSQASRWISMATCIKRCKTKSPGKWPNWCHPCRSNFMPVYIRRRLL